MARKKFKFVEMFIDPKTGAPYEDTGSPKWIKPKHFEPFMGHQIAKIEYEEKKIKDVTYTVGKDGKAVKGEEKERTILVEKMGEKGGWIEDTTNLSQDGKCWVGDNGIVCGNGFVGDDVQLTKGEVGENARVCESAAINGDVGIGGNAYVYGKAKISGGSRIAVKGTARVCGKVEGDAVVEGNAYVGEDGVVKGKATVRGNARVFGTVEGKCIIEDAATVYGNVKDEATVSYEAVILKEGSVKGKAKVESGIVGGSVEGEVEITYGQAFIAEGGSVKGKAKLSGNVFVQCGVSGEAKMTANGSAMEGGSVSGGEVKANAMVKGKSDKAKVGGGTVIVGSAGGGAEFKDGTRVGEKGSVSGGEFSGSANVGGTAGGSMKGNAVVAPEASSTMTLTGNEVFKEGDDREPEGAGVICKVEA